MSDKKNTAGGYDPCEVVGIKHICFDDKTSGKRVDGIKLFLVKDEYGIEGKEAFAIYVSSDKIDFLPKVGDLLNIFYNRYGKVACIQSPF